ncbi:MAG: hypothetical protein LW636_01280 [Planctomycetaceae bacterium]|nr:hypothetical protein [Planctomycetaceae bacterium]
MATPSATLPEAWRELFAGREVAFADLPPPPIKPLRGLSRVVGAALPLLFVTVVGVGVSVWLASAAGRWWIGLVVFCCFAFVMSLLAVGVVGALGVERKDRERRRLRALEDPIGRMLPSRGARRAQFTDPASYAALFSLDPRPVLILDVTLCAVLPCEQCVGTLAPLGRLPEPEILPTSRLPAGTSIVGAMLVFQSAQFWAQAAIALRTGAPLEWSTMVGVAMLALGVYLVVRDPWLRRKLNLPRLFGSEWVIGAGWIRDGAGEVWTVRDSILLLSLEQGRMEARLIKSTKVHAFYLPVLLGQRKDARATRLSGPTGRAARASVKSVAIDAVKSAGESVGLARAAANSEMPGPKEPLRLLLSSWTYPEPRPELAHGA